MFLLRKDLNVDRGCRDIGQILCRSTAKDNLTKCRKCRYHIHGSDREGKKKEEEENENG